MSRSRLLWFSLGFVTSYSVFSHTILKKLMAENFELCSSMERQFRPLEARLSNIESSLPNSSPNTPSAPHQVEG
ncbi:hypothetical protein VNO78_25151 [Psophocarpus tetragonolobus]|uniref:Uncharacterized protein n=1 Tax=Psophocarpus tetragonolobus TaxID=3891 RepID=A0AAN9S6T4_PSOTE